MLTEIYEAQNVGTKSNLKENVLIQKRMQSSQGCSKRPEKDQHPACV